MACSIALVVLGGIGAIISSLSSRNAQMARFARTLGARFIPEKDNIITEITANKMDYFTQYIHYYKNVMTFSQGGTFMRIGDDVFYPDRKPKQKQEYTLFSAELMINHFPYLKIEPISHATHTQRYVQVRTNIEEIDKNYNIYLPKDTALNLPAALCSLLKNQQHIYFESADNVCVIHNYKLLCADEIQPFRFRALQVVTDLEIVPPPPEEPEKEAAPQDAGTRAEAIMAAMMAAHGDRPKAPSKSSGPTLLFIMILLLGVMLLVAYYFLTHMAVR